MDQVQMIKEFLRAMRRHAIVILAVVGLGVVGSIYFALGRQSLYETSAKVLIESQQIPDDLARSTVNLTTSERLQLIEQRLMARDNLVEMIDNLGLFADAPAMPMTNKVDALRMATHFNSITAPQTYGNAANVFAFTVTVQLGDREQAAAVANQFVDSAIQQNLRVRSERVKETLDYFEKEDKRVGGAIAELEVRIAKFKRDNPEALPESLEFRREELRRSQERDLEIDASLLQLQENRAALNLVLIGDAPAGMNFAVASPAETELGRLEIELAQKRKVLAPNHPEIRRLKDQLAAVTALVERAPVEKDDAGAADIAPTSALSQAQQTAVRRQLSQIDAQIQLLTDQKASLATRREELGRSIRDTPEAEITLNALTRQLAELQEQYAVIVQRRAEASTGQQLEASEQSERFHILERALVPDYPYAPNRKKLVVMGSGASVGLAIGLVFLLELLHPVLRTSAQMERQLNLRPVITIPFVATPRDRRRRRLIQIALLSVIIGAVIAGSVAIEQRRHSPEPFSVRELFSSIGLAPKP